MIAVLRGVLVEKHPNQAVVDAGGVGYEVHIPITTYTQLPDAGREVRLRVYTHVREDTLALYGFLSQCASMAPNRRWVLWNARPHGYLDRG